LRQRRQLNPGQIFLDGRMGGRLADEQEMAARGQHGLADRLAGVEVVAEIDGISIGTMHLAKGLEFKAVAVIACDDEVLPLQSRIESATDEVELDDVYGPNASSSMSRAPAHAIGC
jgi:superfamily I DNA/RNA helicase